MINPSGMLVDDASIDYGKDWSERISSAFEDGELQKIMPDVPIAHVDPSLNHFKYESRCGRVVHKCIAFCIGLGSSGPNGTMMMTL